MSVDVNDSTKLKAEHHRKDQFPTWVATFRTFYQRYPEELAKQCSLVGVEVPELWKCLGDELVFCVEITNAEQARQLLRSFREATVNFQKPQSIKLKNAAWLADFPVGNSEVKVSDQASKRPRLDFLGPHMDLGFRLTHKASVRRFVISVELALLVLDSVNPLAIFFEGTEVLKGVLNDMAYPILWIDMLADQNPLTLEERLRGNAPLQHDLKSFCEDFISQSGGQICRPYLPNENNFSQ